MLRIRSNKKGDGLSLNIIVIAVVALLILIILAVIVTRGTGTFSRGVSSCTDASGQDQCIRSDMQCSTGYAKVPSTCKIPGTSEGGFCCTNIDG